MVLERMYSTGYLRKNKWVIMLIAVAYSIFGIGGATLLFRELNPSTVSLALLTLILLATLKDVINAELQDAQGKFPAGALAIFGYLFVGVMLSFAVWSMLLPDETVPFMFQSQENLIKADDARILFLGQDIPSLILNNLSVLAICLIISFLFGISSFFLFIIVWNASAIGVVFGVVAGKTGLIAGMNPILVFMIILVAALPHIILKIFSFFLAGIVGENASQNFFSYKTQNLRVILVNAGLLVLSVLMIVTAALLEIALAPIVVNLLI